VGDGPVGLAVARGQHGPAFGQGVLTQLAVQDELVAGRLHQWRGGVEFVQEQHAAPGARQERGRAPYGCALGVYAGQPAQIDRVEQHGAYVDEFKVSGGCGLGHDLAFAHPGRAPQKGGLPDVHQGWPGRKRFETVS
jgi:hypothetical protein